MSGPVSGATILHRVAIMVVMMVVMMSVMQDYDLFRAGAMPAGLAVARLYLRAHSVAAAANLSARLAGRRIPLDLATGRRALFRLRIWPGF